MTKIREITGHFLSVTNVMELLSNLWLIKSHKLGSFSIGNVSTGYFLVFSWGSTYKGVGIGPLPALLMGVKPRDGYATT